MYLPTLTPAADTSWSKGDRRDAKKPHSIIRVRIYSIIYHVIRCSQPARQQTMKTTTTKLHVRVYARRGGERKKSSKIAETELRRGDERASEWTKARFWEELIFLLSLIISRFTDSHICARIFSIIFSSFCLLLFFSFNSRRI